MPNKKSIVYTPQNLSYRKVFKEKYTWNADTETFSPVKSFLLDHTWDWYQRLGWVYTIPFFTFLYLFFRHYWTSDSEKKKEILNLYREVFLKHCLLDGHDQQEKP
ncbi:MAG: hypothetical protein EB127_05130 [Alphaproteobacteria bacterium]|nr:hypothetical protein [Alphaproteobacteria bacterium]